MNPRRAMLELRRAARDRPALLRRVRSAGRRAAGAAVPAGGDARRGRRGWRRLGAGAAPAPAVAPTFAALALGFGVVVGTAITPNLARTLAGPAPLIAAAPPAEPSAPPPSGGGGAPVASTGPSSSGFDSFSEDSSDSSTGGGKGKKKKKKKKQDHLTGTVVRVNPNAASYVLVEDFTLKAVHVKGGDDLPAPGVVVRVPVEDLENGTYGEDGKRKNQGSAATASFSGTVTFNEPPAGDTSDPADGVDDYVDRDETDDIYTVSGRGASVLVHAADPLPADNTPPPVGSVSLVTVAIADPVATAPASGYPAPPSGYCGVAAPPAFPTPPIVPSKVLQQTSVSAGTVPVATAEIGSIVQATCPAEGTALISADDIRESELSMVVGVAPGINLSALAPGQSIIATGTIEDGATPPFPPGTKVLKTLTGVANDTGYSGADDEGGGQESLLRHAQASRRYIARGERKLRAAKRKK